jgi:ABC-type transporter Mla MlaB component
MGKSDKLPYKVTPSKDSKQVTITLTGNLSLDGIDSIRLMLKQNLNRYNTFHIKLENVESIDLGIIQLLHSFKTSVEQKAKNVNVEFSLQDDHKILLEHAGFVDFINCNQ